MLQNLSRRKKLFLVLVGCVVLVLFYPRQVILVPEMNVLVTYEGGEIVSNGEVSLNWNHYLGDGWKSTVVKATQRGELRFNAVKKRVPLIVQVPKTILSPFGHYYPGLAGSLKARDSDNHFIWKRLDFKSSDCCPEKIVISLHAEKGEADDRYFTFGDVIPNE